ncbi:MAG: hypothetical protein COB02_16385 [Candidatus Cloacimonadota bacterium]|nr:MAG: hypothetical protein COB02_16385 [Candidatus Cloacimonadota bacterium]
MSQLIFWRQIYFLKPTFIIINLLFIIMSYYAPPKTFDGLVLLLYFTASIFTGISMNNKDKKYGDNFLLSLPISLQRLLFETYLPGLLILFSYSITVYACSSYNLAYSFFFSMFLVQISVYIQTINLSTFIKERISLFFTSLFLHLFLFNFITRTKQIETYTIILLLILSFSCFYYIHKDKITEKR